MRGNGRKVNQFTSNSAQTRSDRGLRQLTKNKNEAIEILNARLRIAPALASAEFDGFGAQPRPKVTPGGLRQVIDMVWEAEGYKAPPGAPEKYFDLGYLQKAGG